MGSLLLPGQGWPLSIPCSLSTDNAPRAHGWAPDLCLKIPAGRIRCSAAGRRERMFPCEETTASAFRSACPVHFEPPPHQCDSGAGGKGITGRHWKNAGDLHMQVSSKEGLAVNSAGFRKHKHFTSAWFIPGEKGSLAPGLMTAIPGNIFQAAEPLLPPSPGSHKGGSSSKTFLPAAATFQTNPAWITNPSSAPNSSAILSKRLLSVQPCLLCLDSVLSY